MPGVVVTEQRLTGDGIDQTQSPRDLGGGWSLISLASPGDSESLFPVRLPHCGHGKTAGPSTPGSNLPNLLLQGQRAPQ